MAEPGKNRQVPRSRACSARARWASSTRASIPDIERTVAIKTVRKDLVDPDLAAQVHGALQERGEGRRPAAAPEHRQRLRIRRGRCQRVHRDGVRRGHGPARVPQSQGELRPRADRRDHLAAAAGARLRARARRRASRHQAGEPDPHQRRRAQGRRLRHRAHRHVEPDQRRHGDGHAVVHVARAVPGQGRSIGARTSSAPASCSTSC